MRRLGVHSFVWTDGKTQAGLERALEQSAAAGFELIEFAYLRPSFSTSIALAKRRRGSDSRSR